MQDISSGWKSFFKKILRVWPGLELNLYTNFSAGYFICLVNRDLSVVWNPIVWVAFNFLLLFAFHKVDEIDLSWSDLSKHFKDLSRLVYYLLFNWFVKL